MKNTKKKALTIVLILALFFILVMPIIVQGAEKKAETPDKSIIPEIKTPQDENLKTLAGNIMGYAQWIGIVVAVVMIIFYGVKYFTSAPDKQADLKKAVWGYLIGAACIFGASIILGFIGKSLTEAVDGIDTDIIL